MQFSSRVGKIDISGIRKAFEASEKAINLGLGQPDFDTPEHIKRAAIDAIKNGLTGYTSNLGIQELREAIAQKFKRENGIETEAERVIVTSGASEALHLAIHSLIEPGDEVIVPDPCFVSYPALVHLSDGIPVGVPLGDDFAMEPCIITNFITKRTKAIIINSPSNPTGGVSPRRDIKAFAEIADDNNLVLISDEVYEKFIYEGEHVSPAKYGENVITINATSKTYAMTGWRIGYLTAESPYIEAMLKIHSYIQACAPSISQYAALAALIGPQECIEPMREEFSKRRELVVDRFKKMGVEVKGAKGAFYVFPEVRDEKKITQELLKNGVIVTPGSSFGKNGKNHIRISYAASRRNLEKAMRILSFIMERTNISRLHG
jgi:aspartate aminotransferase